MQGYLTPKQVAEELQVDRRTVYNWLRTKQLSGRKVGLRSWRVDRSDLESFPKYGSTPIIPKQSDRFYPANPLVKTKGK